MSLEQAILYSVLSIGLAVWGFIEGVPVWKSWKRGKRIAGDVFGWAGIPIAVLALLAAVFIWVKYFQGR